MRNFWKDCCKYNCNAAQYIGEICRYLLSAPETPEERRHNVSFCLFIFDREVLEAVQSRNYFVLTRADYFKIQTYILILIFILGSINVWKRTETPDLGSFCSSV